VGGASNTFYLGAAGGGVWKTDDTGLTWHAVFDGIGSASVGALAVAPSRPDTVYAGMGQVTSRYDIAPGDGLYRSDDAGRSWFDFFAWEAIYGLTLGNVARSGAAPLAGYLLGVFGNPHLEGRMWYLYVLWAALMVLGVVRLLGRDNPWWLVLSIVGVMLWPWWGEFKRLQWIYTYVVLGLLARRHEARLRRHARVIGAAGAVAFVPLWLMTRPEQIAVARVSGWLDGSPLAGAGVASLYGLSTITGIAAIAAIVAASYSARQPVLGVLALPGKLSLGIYVVHFYFVEAWHDPSPLWIPVIVAIALTGSMVVTLLLARWRVSATLLLGERWTSKSRPLGDVKTETL
jgi:hypothetical protein